MQIDVDFANDKWVLYQDRRIKCLLRMDLRQELNQTGLTGLVVSWIIKTRTCSSIIPTKNLPRCSLLYTFIVSNLLHIKYCKKEKDVFEGNDVGNSCNHIPSTNMLKHVLV